MPVFKRASQLQISRVHAVCTTDREGGREREGEGGRIFNIKNTPIVLQGKKQKQFISIGITYLAMLIAFF